MNVRREVRLLNVGRCPLLHENSLNLKESQRDRYTLRFQQNSLGFNRLIQPTTIGSVGDCFARARAGVSASGPNLVVADAVA